MTANYEQKSRPEERLWQPARAGRGIVVKNAACSLARQGVKPQAHSQFCGPSTEKVTPISI